MNRPDRPTMNGPEFVGVIVRIGWRRWLVVLNVEGDGDNPTWAKVYRSLSRATAEVLEGWGPDVVLLRPSGVGAGVAVLAVLEEELESQPGRRTMSEPTYRRLIVDALAAHGSELRELPHQRVVLDANAREKIAEIVLEALADALPKETP